MNLSFLKSLLIVIILFCLGGCSSTKLYLPSISGDPNKGIIHLYRESAILGMVANDLIIDIGEGIKINSQLATEGNYSTEGIPLVKYFRYKTIEKNPENQEMIPQIGNYLPVIINDGQLAYPDHPGVYTSYKKYTCSGPEIDNSGRETYRTYSVDGDNFAEFGLFGNDCDGWVGIGQLDVEYYHGQLVGKIGNGDVISWERNPGILKLADMNTIHDHVNFSQNIEIKAGHTYYIMMEFTDGLKRSFTVSENPLFEIPVQDN